MICLAISFWVPRASIVIMLPASSILSNQAGIAVISLDLLSTFFGPQTNLLLLAHAVTICNDF